MFNYSILDILQLKPEEVLDYLRKSQSDDPNLTVEEVLEKHERILDEWAIRHLGAKVPEENKFREIVSGETLRERPEINKVLRLIESPRYKAVKIVEPQRLTRGNIEEIGRVMNLLKLTNTIVITPERIYDLREEYDWDAFKRELERGNDYLNYYKKIQKRGTDLSLAAGNYVKPIPPYGYDKIFITEGKKKCPTLKINPEEAEVVRMIFDMYVNQDLGRVTIAKRLNEMGFKPKKAERWAQDTIKGMLENVHYIGKIKQNSRVTITSVENGEYVKTSKRMKIGEYTIHQGKHEPIISEELFAAAQAKQGRNHRAKPSTKVRNPLAGLLFCQCGRAMSLRTYKEKGVERAPARLLCDNQTYCKMSSALYTEVIDHVREALQQCIHDFEVRLKNDNGDTVKQHAALIKRLEAKTEELNKKEIVQWEAQANPDPSKRMPEHVFKILNERLLKEKEEVRQALCKAYESMPEPVDYMEKLKRFTDALNTLDDPDATAAEKNRLLKACIERIDYKREKAERIKSKQVRYYDPVQKRTRRRSPLHTGGNWTKPPIELDMHLKV